MKKLFKDYFTFSKTEAFIAIILVAVISFFIALPYYYSFKKDKEVLDVNLAHKLNEALNTKDSIVKLSEENKKYNNSYYSKNITKNILKPFSFDPNSISEEGFIKLGLSNKLSKTILNYRNKGGKFKTPDDFRKIWGLSKDDADVLVPYIVIEKSINTKYQTYSSQKYAPQIIDINTATIDEYKRLPNIGNLAYKVFNFREKLGGFISTEQVKETYGMTDSLFQIIQPYLKTNNVETRKLNINTSTDFELSKHPYISNEVARAIVYYRNKYGIFATVNDVKKIVFITPTTFNKMAPYITVAD